MCLHNAWNFEEVFLVILSLFAKLKLMSVLFIHEMFLVFKLETFTNCKEVKHIMVMIVAIIYIFFYLMRYLINSCKLLSENLHSPPYQKKIHPCPFFTHSPTKNSKSASPPLFAIIEHFSDPFCRKEGVG